MKFSKKVNGVFLLLLCVSYSQLSFAKKMYVTVGVKFFEQDRYYGSLETAKGMLKTSARLLLQRECDKYKGFINKDSVKYVTFETGHTYHLKSDKGFKLGFKQAQAACRYNG